MASYRNATVKRTVLPLAACAAAALSLLAASSAWAQAPTKRVAVDPETGQLRAPEADEMPAARANAAARAATPNGGARAAAADERAKPATGTRFGAKGFRVDPSRMSFTVVRRNADGTLATQCVSGESAAQHAMHHVATGGGHDE
jgi:hypothetical protein